MIGLAADAVTSPLITALATGILGLGAGGGLVALLRIRVDKDRIVIDAAQGAVVVQSSVIKDIQEENGRLRAMIEENDRRAAVRERDIREQADRRDAERIEQIAQLQSALAALRARVAAVEDGPG